MNKTNYLLHLHCKTEAYLNIDLKDGQVFRVDSDTDTLTEDQLINNWQDFENSDHQELEQFVNEKVFRKVPLADLPDEVVVVDATWVRSTSACPAAR